MLEGLEAFEIIGPKLETGSFVHGLCATKKQEVSSEMTNSFLKSILGTFREPIDLHRQFRFGPYILTVLSHSEVLSIYISTISLSSQYY